MNWCYLDHAASTPMRAETVAAMLPFLTERYANPSGSHRFARAVRGDVDDAREVVASALGCRPGEVVFTSGGTEADNTAIAGAAAVRSGRAVCSAVEHHAVLAAVEAREGVLVGVDATGHVDLDALAATLAAEPASVVSVMAVNNEVGTITDLAAVAAVVRRHAPGAVLHTDAVQAAPWLALPELWGHVDALSLSAHKFGGPKGAGVLAVRDGVAIAPLLVGGGQERERRSGTHDVAGIAGLAEALRLTDADRAADVARVGVLRDRLVDRLLAELPDVTETVPRDRKVAGSAHVCVDGVENEALLFLLDEAGVCATAAASCASGAMAPSHVLAAMGVPRSRAMGALRLTLGRTTTAEDVERGADSVVAAVRRLRQRAAAR